MQREMAAAAAASAAAVLSIRVMGLVSLVIILGNNMVCGQCQGNVEGLIEECSRYVQKGGPMVEPSEGCCSVVKTVDFPCVCQHITRQVEHIISMEKAVYVASSCGKPLASGTKCGSYTVP